MTQKSRNLYLVWSGIIIGVSLLATPAKFLAPDLSLAEALQVGRVTFRVMAVVEVILLTLSFAIIVVTAEMRWRNFRWPLLIASLLAFQYLGLLPLLGSHTDQILGGKTGAEPSFGHWIYVLTELIKLGVLLTLGLRQATLNAPQDST